MKDRKEIFEKMSVPKAVAMLAIPTVLSQLVNIIYNLTDTFFIGKTGDPFQAAAVNISFPLFFMFIVIANLFGMGGGSLISRLLGKKEYDKIKNVSAISFYFAIGLTLIYTLIVFLFLDQILLLMGASANTIDFSRDYVIWVVIIGGLPTALSFVIAHLLRSEGYAKQASIGLALGGILNVILDPIFMFGLGLQIKGAAIATMLANVVSLIYFIMTMRRLKSHLHISLEFKYFKPKKEFITPILAIGIPSATASLFNLISNVFINNLTASYGDIPLAAMGIVKKIDTIPLSISIGVTQGIIPLIGYNYAAKNFKRMKAFSHFGMVIVMSFSLLCVVAFNLFPQTIFKVFMEESQTLFYGARFLRIAVLATPIMGVNFIINTSFQAMGKGKQSMLLSISRQGLINIPLLFLMKAILGLNGIVWTQLVSDLITLAMGLILYSITTKKLHLSDSEYLKETI